MYKPPYVSIDFEDGNQANYRAINLSIKGEELSFKTGDPIKDWYDMIKSLIFAEDGYRGYVHSSSVDHFYMDGEQYECAYLIKDQKDGLWRFATDEDKKNDPMYYDKGIEFMIPADNSITTWEELKVYCEPDTYGKKKVTTV